MHVNRERLARVFTELCEIESPSRREMAVSQYIQQKFRELGASSVVIDSSGDITGSDTGNVIIRFDSSGHSSEPLFFACHMDTVGPTEGIEVVRNGNIFTSRGDTILGADDKSGIAALVELISLLKENNRAHCAMELIFSTCEEIGLLGAKALDPGIVRSPYGYALDSTKTDKIITGAPAANRLKITVQGKAAHSGSSPESGINALAIAAEVITKIKLGRIDDVSTANFGLIEGGSATNIVPEKITLEGEVRSHSADKLKKYTDEIVETFNSVVANWPSGMSDSRPSVAIEVNEDFPLMSLDENEPVLARIRAAADKLGREPVFDIAGGGSDANIFCGYGLKTAILPTGMAKVHTTEEQVDLNDMVELTELLVAMVS